MSMENPHVNSIAMLHNTSHRALTDFSATPWARLLPFNPLNCVAPLVYNRWSPVYPLLVRHWQMSKGLNKSMIMLSDLELLALPYMYVAPITAISDCQNIDQLY